jgi:hypothetical protein
MDISNISEEIISENEVPSFLSSLESQALLYIQNKDLTAALNCLKRSEEVMESISTQGGTVFSEYVVATLHNIAYCYQE